MTAFIEVCIEGGGRSYIDMRLIERIDTTGNGPAVTASKDKPLVIHMRGGKTVSGFGCSAARVLLAMAENGVVSKVSTLNEDEWAGVA